MNSDDQIVAESSIYRIIAEKQLSVAVFTSLVLALTLAKAFALLPVTSPPKPNQIAAPTQRERLDVACAHGQLRLVDGSPIDSGGIQRGSTVVVHLDGEANECILEALDAGVGQVVLGVSQ